MQDMMGSVLSKTDLEDLKVGSVLEAFLDAEVEMRKSQRRANLIRFLSKLDNRFKKHINPCAAMDIYDAMKIGKL